MSGPDDPHAWIAKAEEDRIAIERILVGEPVPWTVACFLAQQMAEKMLKAFLVANGQAVRKIHDLEALLGQCLRIDSRLDDLRQDCTELTEFAVDWRYPADVEQSITDEKGWAMVEAARRIRTRFMDLLARNRRR